MKKIIVEYELKLNQFIELKKLIFGDTEIKYSDKNNDTFYKSAEPYEIIIDGNNNNLNVLLYSNSKNGGYGMKWFLDIWINGEKITKIPINKTVDENGRANFNEEITW